MQSKPLAFVFASLIVCAPAFGQDAWFWSHRLEIRADYRWSDSQSHPAPFPQGSRMRTTDPGSHVELNVADVQLDVGYGELFAARAKVHAAARHRRNPTSTDRQIDADELFVRFGRKPEFLERPDGTSFFVQAGKFPKMERQPVRLLESYGLAATAFNRFEDVQLLLGGTVGRNFYWRALAANGNPLFMRDPNALAGDNGTEPLRRGETPELGPGFPILYNAETEDLFFDTSNVQIGEGFGYRWQREDESLGFDAIVFHYRRDLSDTQKLTGTFYGGDLDLLAVQGFEVGQPGLATMAFPVTSDTKEEYGARVYAEWHRATAIAQVTMQDIGGLKRQGWEAEAGYFIGFDRGPFASIQPAVRASGINNSFDPLPVFPAPSFWWDWMKFDGGVRVGLKKGFDVTLEYTYHVVNSRFPVNPEEALVTVRWRG